MDLPFDDHRIDDVAEIVARGEIDHLHDTGLGIDLDLANVGARRERKVGRIVERGFIQTGFQLVQRIVMRHVCRKCDFAESLAAIGSLHREFAVLEHDVGFGSFEKVCGDLLPLGHDLVQRLDDCRPANRERARAVGAHAERDAAGIAMHDFDILDRDAQPTRHELRKGRFMPLTMAVRAGEHGDPTGGIHAHFARLE